MSKSPARPLVALRRFYMIVSGLSAVGVLAGVVAVAIDLRGIGGTIGACAVVGGGAYGSFGVRGWTMCNKTLGEPESTTKQHAGPSN